MTTPSDPVFDGSNPHVMADDREPSDSPRPRNPLEEIDRMLLHVPEDHPLRARLTNFRQSKSFKAPEQMGEVWHEGSLLLNQMLPKPHELNDWQQAIVNIWMNTENR